MKKKIYNNIIQRELYLFFLIDNSGSMYGERIDAVNSVMKKMINRILEIQKNSYDVIIKIAVLTFSNNAKWIYEEPKKLENFKWNDIVIEGCTNLSDAYDSLSKFLKKKKEGGQMPNDEIVEPIIILISDGLPTSNCWEKHLNELKKNNLFESALKYAFAIGIDIDETMYVLNKFTGSSKAVIRLFSAENLNNLITTIIINACKTKISNINQLSLF